MATYGTAGSINYDPNRHEYNFSGCCSDCCVYQERDDRGSCFYPLGGFYLLSIGSVIYPLINCDSKYIHAETSDLYFPLIFIAYNVISCVITYFTFTTKCNKPFLNGAFQHYNPKDYMCFHIINVCTHITSFVLCFMWIANIVSQIPQNNLNTNISFA